MYTINLDWLSCSFDLGRFDLESINQHYTVEPITGTQQFRRGLQLVDISGAKFRFYFENPLNPRLAQIVFDNSIFYGLDTKFSIIIARFELYSGCSFKNWQRVDIARDCDDGERFAGYNVQDFLYKFANGKLARLSRYNASKVTVEKEQNETVTTAGVRTFSTKKNEIQSLYFTSRGCANGAKIYNKTLEQKQSVYKPYIFKNWTVNGLNTDNDIYRFELTLQHFTDENSGLYLGNTRVADCVTFFDEQINYVMLFNEEVRRHYTIIDSIRRKDLFKNTSLSLNMYYVKKPKTINDVLNTTPYTRGVTNYIKKLTMNRDLLVNLPQDKINSLNDTLLILNELQSNKFARSCERNFAGSGSNTDPAKFDNVFNHTLLTQKLNSANYKASNRCKIMDEETGEVVAYCNRNSLNLLTY